MVMYNDRSSVCYIRSYFNFTSKNNSYDIDDDNAGGGSIENNQKDV